MSDTPKKINPTVARSRLKQANLDTRTKQKKTDKKREGWGEKAYRAKEERLRILKELMELPDFIVDGRLHRSRGKGYPIANHDNFVKGMAYILHYAKSDFSSPQTDIDSLILDLLEVYRNTQEFLVNKLYPPPGYPMGNKIEKTKRVERKYTKMNVSFDNLVLKIESLAKEIKPDLTKYTKPMIRGFFECVPQATNSDIARHIRNILHSVAKIPSEALPSHTKIRADASKLKKEWNKGS